ncbi:Lipid A core - O-antigen ligase and related enzymes [Klebsiella variicola]|uniref:O-antigen ligase family protein n=1 Tax=Klebsiella variicola TaxID=244366 RepID=UPI000E2C5C39|nr:O-antigen ligase family protein [Klebsiella variicola]SXE67646.1 Lipid A core - O-antigen ligase and related enzymes [Klebsiella variicola]
MVHKNITIYDIQKVVLITFLSICIILPTGSVFDINVKFIFLFLLVILSFFVDNGSGVIRCIKGMLIPVLFLVLFLLISEISSTKNNEALLQTKDILTFFFMTTIAYSFIRENDNSEEFISKVIINNLVFLSALKILIFMYAQVTGISVTQIMSIISDIFNTKLMTLDSDDIAISRISFMSDYVLPIAIYILTKEIVNSRITLFKTITLILLVLSIILSLSRFLWVIGATSIALALMHEIKKSKSIFIVAIAVMLMLYALTLPSVQEAINFRFNSNDSDLSDLARQLQYNAIIDSIGKYPLLGQGLGYYLPTLIRSSAAKYSYELQIPALAMQVGLIGILLFFSIIFSKLYKSALNLNLYDKCIYLILIILWLIGGFFNPVIISSSGGIAFLLLYVLPKRINNN